MDAATDPAAMTLPIIPIGRHPQLLHKAEAIGATLIHNKKSQKLLQISSHEK